MGRSVATGTVGSKNVVIVLGSGGFIGPSNCTETDGERDWVFGIAQLESLGLGWAAADLGSVWFLVLVVSTWIRPESDTAVAVVESLCKGLGKYGLGGFFGFIFTVDCLFSIGCEDAVHSGPAAVSSSTGSVCVAMVVDLRGAVVGVTMVSWVFSLITWS